MMSAARNLCETACQNVTNQNVTSQNIPDPNTSDPSIPEMREAVLPLCGLTPFTLQDFPDYIACIIWFGGCNLRCLYCHNPELVRAKREKSTEDILSFLRTRTGKLDGVVLSGGEATLYAQAGLKPFIESIRKLGFKVKLDTNGLRPDVVKALLDDGLLDYIALDYKATDAKFQTVTTIRGEKLSLFRETLSALCAQKEVPFEVRTTVHTALLDESDIVQIMQDLASLGYTGTYFVQNYRADNDRPTLGHLPPQPRTLDCEHVRAQRPQTASFSISFRNF